MDRSLILSAWNWEQGITERVISRIPEERRDWKPHATSQTAGQLAWHIISSENMFIQAALSGRFGDTQPNNFCEGEGLTVLWREALQQLIRLDLRIDGWSVWTSPFGLLGEHRGVRALASEHVDRLVSYDGEQPGTKGTTRIVSMPRSMNAHQALLHAIFEKLQRAES